VIYRSDECVSGFASKLISPSVFHQATCQRISSALVLLLAFLDLCRLSDGHLRHEGHTPESTLEATIPFDMNAFPFRRAMTPVVRPTFRSFVSRLQHTKAPSTSSPVYEQLSRLRDLIQRVGGTNKPGEKQEILAEYPDLRQLLEQ
jgi:hypothetical protein